MASGTQNKDGVAVLLAISSPNGNFGELESKRVVALLGILFRKVVYQQDRPTELNIECRSNFPDKCAVTEELVLASCEGKTGHNGHTWAR